MKTTFSVFTKPWKTMPLAELGALVSRLGFDGIELPVRPRFQVEPQNVGRDLPRAARELAAFGLRIVSVAGNADEATMAACAEAGVHVIRGQGSEIGQGPYLEAVAQRQREIDALLPLLQKYGVALGVQNHYGDYISNALGLRLLLAKYDPRYVGAIWDAAHQALEGEWPEYAIDIVWSHLQMVNLKNAYWQRTNGPEAEVAAWRPYWTTGRHGLASWPRVAAELKRRGYSGTICLTAEYSDEPAVERLIAEDLAFAKSLIE